MDNDSIQRVVTEHKDSLSIVTQALLGLAGAVVRLCIELDQGRKVSRWKAIAAFITATVLAGGSGEGMNSVLGIPQALSSAGSFIIGVLGLEIIYALLEWRIPFLRKGS